MANEPSETAVAPLHRIPFSYDPSKGDASALDLIYMLYPDWKTKKGSVNVVRFTGGIMNTVGFLFAVSQVCN